MSTGPGDTSVVRTPVPRSSARSTSCSARSPYLLAAYAALPGKIARSAIEPMVTMCPLPRARIAGRNARTSGEGRDEIQRRACRRKTSTDVSCAGAMRTTPALLTTMSGAPPTSVASAADRARRPRRRRARRTDGDGAAADLVARARCSASLAAREQRDARARRGEPPRDRRADAARRAGDERRAALRAGAASDVTSPRRRVGEPQELVARLARRRGTRRAAPT